MQADIHELINKYFDGQTTVQEEELLRRLLADAEAQGSDIDEARAVMGLFAAKRAANRPATSHWPLSTFAKVACITALVAAGTAAFWLQPQTDNENYAEINGIAVSQSQALSQMESDFAIFSETTARVDQSLADDFSAVGAIFR